MDVSNLFTGLFAQNFNHLNQEEKNDLLIKAVQSGLTKEVDGLIKAGANLEAVDNYGNTALIRAAQYGHTPIVDSLVQAGANLEAVDKNGNTALNHAISRRAPDIANLLFSMMTTEQLQQEINRDPINVQVYFDNFKREVVNHRMNAFKTLEPLALYLPADVMSVIAFYYCALGNKAWHAPHAKLDSTKIYDAMCNNGPLTFSSAAPNNKRKAEGELEDERDVRKIKITPLEENDDSFEEEMDINNLTKKRLHEGNNYEGSAAKKK